MIDINKLRRLAQAATPGPWHATKSVETNSWAVWSDTTRLMELRPTKTVDMYRVSNTAAFIAAANPAAISELLDRLEAAEKERDELRAKIERMEKQEPVAWMGRGPRDGRIEFSVHKPSPSVMRDFNMIPLYALPGAQPAPSFADAYQGAMEESAIWKKRALEAEDLNRKFLAEINSPTHMGEPAQPAQSVPECPYPCGWRNLLKLAIEDGAYLARSINEDEPVTENARTVTMQTVMRLRDVLMTINKAAAPKPEGK